MGNHDQQKFPHESHVLGPCLWACPGSRITTVTVCIPFHLGKVCQRSEILGHFRCTALPSEIEGHGTPEGSATRDRASATVLCSDGKWATSKVHLLLACLHESSRATANNAPRPLRESEAERAPTLSPKIATDFSTKRSPQTIKDNRRAKKLEARLVLRVPNFHIEVGSVGVLPDDANVLHHLSIRVLEHRAPTPDAGVKLDPSSTSARLFGGARGDKAL